jgi:hypothetical protein
MSRLLRILLAVAGPVFIGAVAVGQAINSAQIHGTVSDPTGAAIVGAEIKATQIATGLVRTTTSSAEGSYYFPDLPVGAYQLAVTAPGFESYLQKGITLQVSENPKIDVKLKIGAVTQTEEVRADAVMVKTDETSLSQVIDHQRIVDLPLDGRQATDLILLSGAASNTAIPGNDLLSSKNYGNGDVASSVTATISVAGGQQNGNNYLLDGGDHVDKFSNVNMPFPFPDAIQEFSVQTSTLTARYGAHPGSVVNVVTKSGSNSLHGDIFEFLRNDAVNAHHWVAPSITTGPNPNDNALHRNQFGGTLGGPIVRNKVQIFAGYQGTRNFQMQAPTQVVVPTAAALTGDFSTLESTTCLSKARTLKDPSDPTNKKTFAGNQVPTIRFNQQALNVLQSVPVSTDPCGRLTLSIPNTGDEDQGVSRVDWEQSSKNTIFGRYFITDFRDPPIFSGNNLLTTTKAGQFARNQSAVIGDTYTFTSSVIDSTHITANRMAIFRGPAGNVPTPAQLGINVPSPVASALVMSISSYFNVESGTATPGHFNNNSLQVANDLDWMSGKHQLGFGINWVHSQLNELSTFQSNGQFNFGGSGAGASGDGLVDFLLGDVQTFAQGNNEQENWRQNYYGLYGQDTYRARSNLTLSGGLRWEPYLPAQDRYHRGGHFDPVGFATGTVSSIFPNAPAGLFFCGDSQTPCPYVNSHLLNFSPRAGINWDPRGKGRETIRAGYGLFFDSPEEFYFDRFADNSPYGSGISLSRPTGGLTNPYSGQTVPPFPQPLPTAGNPATAFFPKSGVYVNLPLNLRPTYVQQWNLSIDKQFGSNWMVSASYLGNRTNHLWLGYDANAPVFIPGSDCSSSNTAIPTHGAGTSPCSTTGNEQVRRFLNLRNPASGAFFSSISTATDEGNASYNGLLFSVNHRFSQHFTLQSNYTWSHCIDIGAFAGELSSSRLIANPNNFAADRGNCSFDIRHIFNSSLVASSPAIGNRLARTLTGNWQFSTIVGYRTGNHFSALGGTDASVTGIKQDRADIVGDPTTGTCTNGAAVGTPTCWFNTSAFVTNAAGTFGTSGRNILEGPGFLTFNAGVSRQFKIRESQSLMLRFEAFNLLNHPNFANPVNSNPTSSQFGQITSTLGTPRVLQVAGKYIF